jgi:hypothetical protein
MISKAEEKIVEKLKSDENASDLRDQFKSRASDPNSQKYFLDHLPQPDRPAPFMMVSGVLFRTASFKLPYFCPGRA